MTREEFVRNGSWILKVIRDTCELTEAETDYLNHLIEVLEQEPCEDCISRQAVLDAIEDDNRNGNYSCFASNNDAECFKDVIRSLSSVTPKPKTDVLDKIRAVVIRWQTDTWTDNLSYECMCKIADILPVKIRNESEEQE